MKNKSYAQEWLKDMKSKYSGETLTATAVLELRNDLVEKFGRKIIPGMTEELTEPEMFARKEYEILSKQLYDASPKIKKIDALELKMFKIQDFLKSLPQKFIWIVLPLLIALALIKYLFS